MILSFWETFLLYHYLLFLYIEQWKDFYFQYSSITNIFSVICIDWLQNIFWCIKKIRICLWACDRLDDSHLLFTHWVVAVAGSFITTCSENLIAPFYQDKILSIVFTSLRISEHFTIYIFRCFIDRLIFYQ